MSAPAVSAVPRDYVVDLPQKSDAPAIARCFLEVYGHHYVHSEVFSTHRYWGKVESGELIPVVARDGQGDVIGHVALERESGALVAERGEAVVLSAYRGHHLLERMTERLSAEAPKHGLHGIYAEPLTIHTFSQRNDERAGMPVCAVLLGANPESFRPKDIALPDRGAAPELSPHLSLRAAARRAHDPRTRALSGDAAQDLREPRRDGIGGGPGGRGAPDVAHQHQGQRSRLRRDPFRADRPATPPSSSDRRCATCARSAPARCNSPPDRRSRSSAPDRRGPRLSAFSSAASGRRSRMARTLFLLQLLSEPLDTGKLQLFTDATKELVAFIDRDRIATAQKL